MALETFVLFQAFSKASMMSSAIMSSSLYQMCSVWAVVSESKLPVADQAVLEQVCTAAPMMILLTMGGEIRRYINRLILRSIMCKDICNNGFPLE